MEPEDGQHDHDTPDQPNYLASRVDEGGKHGPVRPVQTRTWVGAAQDGDLVAQHEEFDVLGG
jgi:hypothetical protein